MKIIITTISLILSMTAIFSQKIDVPNNALSTFEDVYNDNKTASGIVWIENAANFQVFYEYNGKKRNLLFDKNGIFKESRVYIDPIKLNEKSTIYITDNYSINAIIQCYAVTSNTAPERNEVEITENGTISTLCFRPNGDFHYKK